MDRFQPRSATGAPVWRHQLTPDQSADTFRRSRRVQRGGFLPRRFVHFQFGHADRLRWWLGRGPRKWSFWKLTLRRAASSRLEMLNWWNERQGVQMAFRSDWKSADQLQADIDAGSIPPAHHLIIDLWRRVEELQAHIEELERQMKEKKSN